jgi:predicted permease
LSLPALPRDRETRIVRELSSQLDDFYREALARGLSEDQADEHARAQIPDWSQLAATLREVEHPHRRSDIDRWSERFDDRARSRRGRWMAVADLWQDIRYATRRLSAQRGFALVVILTLALGIGANSAIFSLADALFLSSLPVDRPQELVLLKPAGPRNGWTEDDLTWSYPAYRDIRERQRVFAGLIAERVDSINFTIDGTTTRAIAGIVSGNYFDVLGVRAFRGRLLTDADDRVRSGHPVAVLSHGFWVDRLGMRPDIIGQDVRIGGSPFTIVGIADRRFNGLEIGGTVDVFVSTMMLPNVVTYTRALDTRSAYIFHLYGRLERGMERANAEARLQPIYIDQIGQDNAAMSSGPPPAEAVTKSRIILEEGRRGTSTLRGDLEAPLTAVFAMTLLLLVISCANIASLQIARASARVKEISIRLAIGASRFRLVRQLLTESALLVTIGVVAALAIAAVVNRALIGEMGEQASRLQLVTPFFDSRMLAFTLMIAGSVTLAVGLLPAALTTRPAVWQSLRAGVTSEPGGHLYLRRALVIAQLSLSLVLVVACGLFGRTVYNLRHADTGFRTERLLQFSLDPGAAGYSRQRTEASLAQVLHELQSLPGVEAATLAVVPVLNNGLIGFGALDVDGYVGPNGRRASAGATVVAPGYFQMINTPLVRGRDFSDADTAQSRRVAIVSETFVARYLPKVDPIGRTITLGYGGPNRFRHEIIGVVKDARLNNLRDAPPPVFYLPYTQFDVLSRSFVLARAAGDPSLLRRPIEQLVQRIDAQLPVIGFVTIDTQIDRVLRPERLLASLSLWFGALATGLGALGLYGVMAFVVARRTREIGVRMALGADRRDVRRMILRGAAGMAAIGIGLGGMLAFALGRYVESQLYGVSGRDLLTLGAAALLLLLVIMVSGWLPAQRASRVDPLVALREE